jgi:hypothetical protein
VTDEDRALLHQIAEAVNRLELWVLTSRDTAFRIEGAAAEVARALKESQLRADEILKTAPPGSAADA